MCHRVPKESMNIMNKDSSFIKSYSEQNKDDVVIDKCISMIERFASVVSECPTCAQKLRDRI